MPIRGRAAPLGAATPPLPRISIEDLVVVLNIDRRSLILGGGLGLAAIMRPAGRALAAELLGATGFTHNVASGEPGPDCMLLWTRYVPATGDNTLRLEVEVALDPNFTRVVSGGSVRTGAFRDWTAKITVDGLRPATVYWYRFVAQDGTKSPVGRTKTLPVGPVAKFGLGVFSCSNLPYGQFNAYGHAAARPDLDLWLHTGDYIYEYGATSIREDAWAAGRTLEPATEILAIADYRLRFGCYRADPDLQRLHQMAPMVALWDDHESANDSWEGGAQITRRRPKAIGICAAPPPCRFIANGCLCRTSRGRPIRSERWRRSTERNRGCWPAPGRPTSEPPSGRTMPTPR